MKAKILLGGALLTVFSLPALAQKEISYKNDIFPIFQDYCLSCHVPGGKGYNKSGFDLRTYQSLMKGTKFGPVIQPGSSLTSTLNVLVSGHASPAISMPYGIKGGLPKDKSSLLNKWVDQGAKNN
jgi:mono/diheme cytochrome c family protein